MLAHIKKQPAFWIALVLCVLEFAWGTAFTVTTPPFEGPDEYYHYCYVALIARNRSLPKPYPLTPVPYTDRHPPLYYLLGAALVWDLPVSCYHAPSNPYAVFDNSTSVDDNRNLTALTHSDLQAVDIAGLRRVRLLSVFLGSLTIVFVYLSARVVFKNDNLWAAATAILVAALPPFAWISSFVNNDNLSIFMGTLITYCSLQVVRRGAASRRTALFLGALAGVSLMTKFSLWLFIPTMLAILLLNSWRTAGVKHSLINGLLFSASLLLISAWWFIRNGLLVPALAGLGQLRWLGPIRWERQPTLGTLLTTAANQVTGVWDRYGYQVELPPGVETAGLCLAAVAIIGLFIYWLKAKFKLGADKPIFWIGVIGALDLASGIYAVWISRDAGQGRYLYPGIASLCILLMLGWSQFWPKAWRLQWYPRSVIGGMALFSLTSFFFVYRTAYQLPQFYPQNRLPAQAKVLSFNFENVAELVGAGVTPAKAQPGAKITVTACWKPLSQASEVIETVTVLDYRATQVASRSTLPGLGRYPAVDWEVGRTFCDNIQLQLPADAAPQNQYQVAVGLSNLRATQADGQTVDPVIVADLVIPSTLIKLPPQVEPLDASLEGDISLLGYTLTYTSTAPGARVQLDLFWRTTAQLPDSYHVFVHWLDAQGQLMAQDDGLPGYGAYPTNAWGANEIIQDSHTLTLGDSAAAGLSQFSVGLYQYSSGQRLATFGPLSQDNAILFPSIKIER
jgi:4-amino-4-deoxy-L-arabinose transferase-like glycosyltransferase